jgi:hypothetical protein
MHDDLAGIEARLVWDALARVFWRAREREGLGSVEGGGFANFARLVRVDLFIEDRPSDDGALTRLKVSGGGLRRGGSPLLLRWLWRRALKAFPLRLRDVLAYVEW